MIHYDVNTFHMDNVYSQHKQSYSLTTQMQFATNLIFVIIRIWQN
jgi:hypothetical protein